MLPLLVIVLFFMCDEGPALRNLEGTVFVGCRCCLDDE